jgi:hypothetical protein
MQQFFMIDLDVILKESRGSTHGCTTPQGVLGIFKLTQSLENLKHIEVIETMIFCFVKFQRGWLEMMPSNLINAQTYIPLKL